MSTSSRVQPVPAAPKSQHVISGWNAAIPPLLVGTIVALLPVPAGLKPQAWYYFSLFAAVIVGVITEPLPATAVGVIGVSIGAALGLVEPRAGDAARWAISGFSNTTVFLVFSTFIFAMGIQNTGLGRRVALFLVKTLGGRTLGLGYSIALADLVVAPLTPSNTARSGGIIYSIIRSIPPLSGSEPGGMERKLGACAMYTAFAATCLNSSTFATGCTANVLALVPIEQTLKLEISWTAWRSVVR